MLDKQLILSGSRIALRGLLNPHFGAGSGDPGRTKLDLLILGLLLIILIALSSGCVLSLSKGCTSSIVEVDNVQERLDTAAPLIAGPNTVGQTFVSHYPRLSAIELLLVVYPQDGSPPDAPRHLTFHLRSDPQDEADIVTLTVDTSNWKHNDPYRFSFPPQADSENETYYFFLDATEGNKTTVWHSSLDAYGEGAVYLDGQSSESDLYFKTYYDYNLASIALDIWHGLRSGLWLVVPLLALFICPGYLLHSLLSPKSEPEPLEHLALVVGLSLALVPLALLFCSALDIALNETRVLVAAVALSIGAFVAVGLHRFQGFGGGGCVPPIGPLSLLFSSYSSYLYYFAFSTSALWSCPLGLIRCITL